MIIKGLFVHLKVELWTNGDNFMVETQNKFVHRFSIRQLKSHA